MERLGDEALLAAVALGDDTAATVFVRRFQRRVFGLALTITGDPPTAEDVAQQTFERVWRHAGTYDARRGGVTTWVLTIARNLAIDTLRVRRATPIDHDLLAELLGAGGPAGAGADLAEGAAVADQVGRAREALRSLPVEQQRAVVLATVMGRTSTEIADAEGVPIPTVKFRIQSGLRKLRAAMAERDT